MYKKQNGFWKSDFIINKIRYQKTWTTKIKKKALEKEDEWKKHIINPIEYLNPKEIDLGLSFKDATSYIYETKWIYFRDKKNPLMRWEKISMFFGESRLISTLTVDDLDRFKRYLIKKNYANKTINHYISTLKTSIEYLENKQKLILDNKLPFEGLRMPVYKKRKICFSRYEEYQMYQTLVERYKETNNSTDWEMIKYFIINISLGLRPAEYFNLQLGDFDFYNNHVTISRGSFNSTKNNLIRTLPLEGIVLKAIKEHIKYSVTIIHKKKLPIDIELKDIVSDSKYKTLKFTRLTNDMVRKRWTIMKKHLNWTDKEIHKDYVPYGLRHTVASRLASESKWNGYKIMTFMGHKSYHTSLNYIHLGVNDIKDGSIISNQDITLYEYVS